jgi:uncharacterized protein involved in outer membrane biogenesis
MTATDSSRSIRRHWPFVLAGVVLLLAMVALLWDWNWFRPLLAAEASTALGRPVTLGGFQLHLSRYPEAVLEQVAVANPDDMPPDSKLAMIDRLSIRIDPRALFDHRLKLTQIELQHPVLELRQDVSGHPNWTLGRAGGSLGGGSGWTVDPGQLLIHDGHVHFLDPALKSDFALDINTEDAGGGGESRIVAGIAGRYAGQPVSGRFVGGSVLSLRDPQDRYPVDLKLANGATHVSLQGTLLEPLKFGGADLRLDLAGEDLANLYPLTGIPLAPTPPYQLSGRLDYAPQRISFSGLQGTVGGSDLAGDLSVRLGGARPLVEASLRSKRVVLADLRGFIGAAPGKEDAPNLSRQQQQEHARQDASGKLLPDIPINLPKLRSVDFDVRYQGQHIESESTPLDNLQAHLKVDDGRLALEPLSFGVGSGQIVLNLKLDGQQEMVHANADIDFRQVELSRIMQSTGIFKGAGTIGGSARIDSSGNSLAQMLGHGDGEMKLFMNGGDLSALLIDLAGLDFGRSVAAVLGLPRTAQLRCLVSDFGLKQGVLDTRTFIFDTSSANIIGSGTINLRDEQTDYKLSTQPKRFSIGALNAPILIQGPLKNPSVHPDPVALGERGAAAAVLGVFLTPLAALLPTIQLGLGKDNNCDALLASVQAAAAKVPAKSPAKPPG